MIFSESQSCRRKVGQHLKICVKEKKNVYHLLLVKIKNPIGHLFRYFIRFVIFCGKSLGIFFVLLEIC